MINSILGQAFKSIQSSQVDLDNPEIWDTSSHRSFSESGGQQISPTKAFKSSAYFACIRNIAEDIGSLPIDVFSEDQQGKRTKRVSHPVSQLINERVNDEMSAYSFWETLIGYRSSWGNGIAEIIRDPFNGRPKSLMPIEPWRIEFETERSTGEIFYVIQPQAETDQEIRVLTGENVLHLKGLGTGRIGYSMLQFQAQSMGIATKNQEFLSSFLGQGAHAGHVVTSQKELGTKGMENLRNSLRRFRDQQNWGKVLFLREGVKLETMAIPLRDAQFLELMQFSNSDIARWFRMPLRMIQSQEHSKNSPSDEVDREYAKYTLCPIAVMVEQEIKRKLLPRNSQLQIKHNFNEILRADQKARSDYYRNLFQSSGIRPNDILKNEGFEPTGPEGDETYAQINIAPLRMLKELAERNGNAPGQNERAVGSNEDPVEPEEDQVEMLSPIIKSICNSVLDRYFKIKGSVMSNKTGLERSTRLLKADKDLEADAFNKLYPIFASLKGGDLDCIKMITAFVKDLKSHESSGKEFRPYVQLVNYTKKALKEMDVA